MDDKVQYNKVSNRLKSDFLKKHYTTINALAKSSEMSVKIKDEKLAEMIAIFTENEPEPEQLEYMLDGYENYVLLTGVRHPLCNYGSNNQWSVVVKYGVLCRDALVFCFYFRGFTCSIWRYSFSIVWDSDGFVSVEEVEEHILPIIDLYYNEVKNIEARNELIRR